MDIDLKNNQKMAKPVKKQGWAPKKQNRHETVLLNIVCQNVNRLNQDESVANLKIEAVISNLADLEKAAVNIICLQKTKLTKPAKSRSCL
jgi:endonuclease III-like uncharacterized protein